MYRPQIEKPPLGPVPRFVWEENRLRELGAAIHRNAGAGARIPPEWVEEYNELLKRQPKPMPQAQQSNLMPDNFQDLVGQWSDEKCPLCGDMLMKNGIGERWCSNKRKMQGEFCNYGWGAGPIGVEGDAARQHP